MKINKIFPLLLSTVLLFACNNNPTPSNSGTSTQPPVSDSTPISVEPVTTITVAEARAAEKDTSLAIEGIVTAFNYSGQTTPYIAGFWVSDPTDTIYIYSEEVAATVAVGNKIVVKGTKAYYIPENDQGAAEQVSYAGMAQLVSPEIVSNDKKVNEIPATAINTKTIAELSLAPLTTDISGKIYKVKGYYHKYVETGYTNYGMTDLNRVDSLNAYTQSNGKDYAWTDSYDNKAVEMLLITSLAKPGSSEWKFCPIKFNQEITVSDAEEAQYGAERALNKINAKYFVNTKVTVSTGDDLLAGLTRLYSSEASQISISVVGTNNIIDINTLTTGIVSISASATYHGVTKTLSKEIGIQAKPIYSDVVTIENAKKEPDNTEIRLDAVVAAITYKSGLTRQGLFLADETGSIFVFNDPATMANLNEVEVGNRIVVKGLMKHYIKDAANAEAEGYSGDLQLTNVTVNFIDSNIYEIPSEAILNSTVVDIMATLPSTNISSLIYKVSGILRKGSYGSLSLESSTNSEIALPFYTQNSGKDFLFLTDYVGKNIEIIVGIQNLNLRSANSNWRACPIQVL